MERDIEASLAYGNAAARTVILGELSCGTRRAYAAIDSWIISMSLGL